MLGRGTGDVLYNGGHGYGGLRGGDPEPSYIEYKRQGTKQFFLFVVVVVFVLELGRGEGSGNRVWSFHL